MRWPRIPYSVVFVFVCFFPSVALAQTPSDDLDTLPLTISQSQLASLSNWTPAPQYPPAQFEAWNRQPTYAPQPLTPQQIEYRNAIEILGTDKHHFVHVELLDGEILTGAISSIGENGFCLRSGILASDYIFYSRLKEPPRRVPAVGTHIINGFKWAGTVVGVSGLIILSAPLFFVYDWD